MKKPRVSIAADVRLDDLACQLSHCDRDQVLEMILAIDDQIADFDFTVELRDKLNEAIKKEVDSND